MFIGHFAVGFASKRLAPPASLGVLVAAPLALDLLWPLFLVSGLERVRIDPGNTAFTPLDFVSYPYSHSLLAAVGWAILFALLYWLMTRYVRGAAVIGLAVVSHWILDAATHRPDLLLAPGGTLKIGMGLWNSVLSTMVIEGVMFCAGVWLYATMTQPRDGIGRYSFYAFVVVLVLSYVANAFGPPPPSEDFLARFSVGIWLFPFWAAWFDSHRQLRLIATK